jgi:CDP-glucose 4,6-dehydratase
MNDFLSKVFAGRSVLVTGHTGFKGSWLALWLARLGALVTGYSLAPPTYPSNFEVSHIRDILAAHHESDIRDSVSLTKVLQALAPEVVFHLAAQSLVRESYRVPKDTFDVNIMGTVNLLECLRKLKHPCVVVVVTSDKCYENREQMEGYRETDFLGGFDPYSASKGAAEIAIASYRRSFFPPACLKDHGLKLASARAGNVIGGGDWALYRIGTDIVNALNAGQPVPIRNPQAIRPWQHVLEPLSGYLSLAARMLTSDDPKWCSAWNFGPFPNENLTVLELVKIYCAAWGGGAWRDMSCPAAPHEAGILQLNIDKAVKELGWRPRWSAAEAVRRAAGWYKAFYQKPDASMRQVCYADMAAYESAATGQKFADHSSQPKSSGRQT